MESVRRFTNLAATIHLLHAKQITLLNPATWDDRNDAYFMAEYKRQRNAQSVLALCFTEGLDSYHHWRVFSHGSDGVCIEFDMERLSSALNGDRRVKIAKVKYRKLDEQRELLPIKMDELPFLKRIAYRDEREIRAVYVDCDTLLEYKNYKIEVNWIKRITLSPWMPTTLANSVKATLKSMDGCSKIEIVRSTLIESEIWKNMAHRDSKNIK